MVATENHPTFYDTNGGLKEALQIINISEIEGSPQHSSDVQQLETEIGNPIPPNVGGATF